MARNPQIISSFDIEELSKDPKNQVYTFTNDTATATFNSNQQKQIINQLRSIYLELRKTHPDQEDYKIRDQIKKDYPLLAPFIENNTRIFETCTNRDSPEEHISHLKYMLYLREQQELGNLGQGKAQEMIQDYLLEQFKTNMTLEEYNKITQSQKSKKTTKNQNKILS